MSVLGYPKLRSPSERIVVYLLTSAAANGLDGTCLHDVGLPKAPESQICDLTAVISAPASGTAGVCLPLFAKVGISTPPVQVENEAIFGKKEDRLQAPEAGEARDSHRHPKLKRRRSR